MSITTEVEKGKLFTDSNGYVGIGTTNPLCSLYNYEDKSSGWAGMSYFGNNTSGVVAGAFTNVAYFGGHNAALNAWTDLAINPDGGNVGIGTNDPNSKLQINNGDLAIVNSNNYQVGSGNVTDTVTNNMLFKHDTNPAYSSRYINTTAKISSVMETTTTDTQTGRTSLSFYTATGWLTSSLTLSEKMRIRGNGYVGIGTISPSQKLHVVGNIYATGSITPSDKRIKTDISSINDATALNQINQLESYEYNYIDPERKKSQIGRAHV